MLKTALLTAAILTTGCNAIKPAPTTTIPTDEFTAQSHYYHPAGSAQIAHEEAERFCKHWNAKPGIINTETIDLKAARNPAGSAKQMADNVITSGKLFKKEMHHQTTIKYKCY